MLGRRLELGSQIRNAIVAPQQDYVLAIRSEDLQVVVIPLNSDTPHLSPVTDAPLSGDVVIATSPRGSTAALYDHVTKVLRLFRGLPSAPEMVLEFDASSIPGRAISLAISDDAAVSLVGFSGEDADTLWAVDALGPRPISSTHATSLVFILDRYDAVVVDDRVDEAFLLLRVNETATRIPLLSASDGVEGLSGAAASDDGRRVFVTGARSRTIGIVDLEGGAPRILPCDCIPTGVHRLGGGHIYRLSDPPNDVMRVLDLSQGEPRILHIPPDAKTEGDGLQ
jgi:hypothetical protein